MKTWVGMVSCWWAMVLWASAAPVLNWTELASLPPDGGGAAHPGLAGPFAGAQGDVLLIAGGANFPNEPLWQTAKVWHESIYVLEKVGDAYLWHDGGTLTQPLAYGAAVSTARGVICMGGDDGTRVHDGVFRLAWDPVGKRVTREDLPVLPSPCAYGQATLIGSVVYLAGGQRDASLGSALNNLWSLDLAEEGTASFAWKVLDSCPGGPRAFNLTVSQHNGFDPCVYVMSGRREEGDAIDFLTDVWEYDPSKQVWRARAELPRCVMAGTACAFGQSHLYVLGGADGSLWNQVEALKDAHPGFPKEALLYHTITNTWTSGGPMPANQVTTVPVSWQGSMVIPSGEVRPRVRSPQIWSVRPAASGHDFGWVNQTVLIGYLLLMVGVGVYFARRNKTTEDFFRGGKKMAWWAAGCSIFATMLSSLTYTGLPSKAYAQDWVYLVGNMTIPLVAIVAVSVALPFYRRIDATSAYEYLEKRFSRAVRQIGSAFFTLYHLFRMAVVMSLTALAIATATPLTPAQSVILMGVLSILYCAMGGIEAVIWTDTIQTVVLLGGAIIAFMMLISGTDGGFGGMIATGQASEKFRMAHFHWDPTSAQIAIWFIVLGAIGQNLSSYTADQAVVQRYMTTPDERLAARSIWTNAILSILATFLFFGLGAALFVFYQAHPEKLDPSLATDQILPLYITREMPVGLAGLIVAGIFAAAQSTVSTSMNSTATTLVTDFLQPMKVCQTDTGYLGWARGLTVLMGVFGTLLGLIFIDPEIKSLFDAFVIIIGLFMGVLGGLFALGVLTERANSTGALVGGLAGACIMFFLWKYSAITGYLYTTIGISACILIGYATSLILPGRKQTEGLTIRSLRARD